MQKWPSGCCRPPRTAFYCLDNQLWRLLPPNRRPRCPVCRQAGSALMLPRAAGARPLAPPPADAAEKSTDGRVGRWVGVSHVYCVGWCRGRRLAALLQTQPWIHTGNRPAAATTRTCTCQLPFGMTTYQSIAEIHQTVQALNHLIPIRPPAPVHPAPFPRRSWAAPTPAAAPRQWARSCRAVTAAGRRPWGARCGAP
jgi:hypothetical protein